VAGRALVASTPAHAGRQKKAPALRRGLEELLRFAGEQALLCFLGCAQRHARGFEICLGGSELCLCCLYFSRAVEQPLPGSIDSKFPQCRLSLEVQPMRRLSGESSHRGLAIAIVAGRICTPCAVVRTSECVPDFLNYPALINPCFRVIRG